ncbi:MAG: TonB-dependent receptor [Magnetococcales bacterium]|nr:TonB-dependent receptor [Magnetococcales bacterium]
MNKKFLKFVFFFLSGTVFPSFASDLDEPGRNGPDQESSAFRNLMSVMEETTSIATKTKMNADFVPGMVTVLYGEDMEAKGATKVLDALMLVPGLHVTFENLIMRGVDKWGSGKVKLLLNGHAVNHSVTANPTPPLNIPIQAIERIEVVRGPGSTMYGENAYLGVVNIITHTQGKKVFAGYGSYATYTGGGYYTYTDPESGLTANLNVAGLSSVGEHVTSREDILYSPAFGQAGISYAPGPVSNKNRERFSMLNLNYKQWTLEARLLASATTDGFGTADAIPPPGDHLAWQQGEWGVNLEREVDWRRDWHTKFKFGWSRYAMEMDHLSFFPPGFISLDANGGLVPHPDGVVGSSLVREERFEGGMEMTWNGFKDHQILVELDQASSRLVDTWSEANVDPLTLAPIPWQRVGEDKSWIKNGAHRTVSSLIFQDQYAVTDRLDITAGVRMDHYDDVGNDLSPRLAAVYRLTDHHILKAQYGHAFRPPTFFEMYSKSFVINGNPGMKPETINTYELGYIYRTPDKVGRVTMFHSLLNNLIIGDNLTGLYQNSTGARIDGVELEFEYALTNSLKLDGTVSFLSSLDEATGHEIEFASNWLGRAGVFWQPWVDHTLAVRYFYVGESNRVATDPRDKLDSYTTINVVGTRKNFLQKDLTLRASVLNVFDEKVMAPSVPEIPQDYPRPGRSWMLNLSHSF